MSIYKLVNLLPLIVIFIGLCFAESWLARRKSSLPGLFLPVLSGLWALLLTGDLILIACRGGTFWQFLLPVVLCIGCLPAALYTFIFLRSRRKQKTADELQRMRITDL